MIVRAGDSDSDIPPPDVRELASMARMQVTDEEVEQWGPKLATIAGWSASLPPSLHLLSSVHCCTHGGMCVWGSEVLLDG